MEAKQKTSALGEYFAFQKSALEQFPISVNRGIP